jgi:hypothetical protein
VKQQPKQPGTMVHLGRQISPHFSYLDKYAEERDVTRNKIVNDVLAYVFKNRMLKEIFEDIDRSTMGDGHKPCRPIEIEKPMSQIIQTIDVIIEDKPRRTDLPEPSRRPTSPPCPELRPRYITTRSVPPYRHNNDKPKSQLRDEIRQAVENTR